MYKKISDYGIIGDMHSAALVSKDGCIDYCSMPHIDSPTVFASLLDDEKGGYFSIKPKGEFISRQEYIKDTNILKCSFKTGSGEAVLTDFMPVKTRGLFEGEDHTIHRCLRGVSGKVEFELEFFPRPQYAGDVPEMELKDNVCKVRSHKEVFTFVFCLDRYALNTYNHGIILKFSVSKNKEAHFDLICGDKDKEDIPACRIRDTEEYWRNWIGACMGGRCSLMGEYADMINRSLLVLKLLTFQPTGAIAAAATTSLPETIGGGRNWDYRFTWIRDASFTLKALFTLGHTSEADSFVRWLHATYRRYGGRNLQIMYSLEGKDTLEEKELSFLKGYMESRPVRTGNGAYNQKQWDIYGEVMDTALRLSDYAGRIDTELWPFFKDICGLAAANWEKPDNGIWEMRNGPHHFVYSKVMCWVALDRGIRIAEKYGFTAPINIWKSERERIKKDIIKNGYNKDIKSFVQRYGANDLDSSLLLLPLVNFLPVDDKRIEGTINACRENLMRNGFLLRYSACDGIDGEEGGFILCNFWLIECLALSGKIDEAKEILDRTIKAGSRLGLFSEEYDFKNGRMLGNFPQAFSHIGYINSVSAIINAGRKGRREKTGIPLVKRLRKLIPLHIELNKTSQEYTAPAPDTAARLKALLGRLQGAFFDTADGRVDYKGMKSSPGYKKYLNLAERLNFFDLSILNTDNEKKAFWINMYNTLIIHGVIELGIQDSVKEVFNFFGRISYRIGGLVFSADDIEHGILRKNKPHPASGARAFSPSDKRLNLAVDNFDPRIHFSLVCASSSCPPIEFYDASKIDRQLDTAGRSFINRKGIILDKNSRTLYMSQIFKWYQSDFGSSRESAAGYIAAFAGEETKNYILSNLGKLKIKYLPYNWSLNKPLS